MAMCVATKRQGDVCVRRIIYWGNCQMLALHNLHNRFIAPVTDEVTVWVNPYETTVEDQRVAMAGSDLIVAQVNARGIVAQVHAREIVAVLKGLVGSTKLHLVP